MHLPPPPVRYWYTSFFFLAGPGPRHEIAVSAFWRSPLGRANTFSFLFLILTPRKSLLSVISKVFLLHFVSYPLTFAFLRSFLLFLSCTPQTSLWTVSLLGFLLYVSVPFRLRYPTYSSSRPFGTLSRTAASSMEYRNILYKESHRIVHYHPILF